MSDTLSDGTSRTVAKELIDAFDAMAQQLVGKGVPPGRVVICMHDGLKQFMRDFIGVPEREIVNTLQNAVDYMKAQVAGAAIDTRH
ncbi:MAG: hypothetical protein V4530_00345 [Pseudomonadota bacterium]